MTGTRRVPAAPKHATARDSRRSGGTAPHLHWPAQPPCPQDGSGLQRRLQGPGLGLCLGHPTSTHSRPSEWGQPYLPVLGSTLSSSEGGALAMLTRGPEAGSWLPQAFREPGEMSPWRLSAQVARTSRVPGGCYVTTGKHILLSPTDSSSCKPGQPESGFTKVLCPGPDTEEERLGCRNQATTPRQ